MCLSQHCHVSVTVLSCVCLSSVMSVTALSCISLSTVMCLSQYCHVCHASVIPVSYMRVPQTDGAIC